MKKFFRGLLKVFESILALIVALLLSPIVLLIVWLDFLCVATETPWIEDE